MMFQGNSPTGPGSASAEAVRTTQRDVAARFGCHRSTVSLALSGHPSIPEPVRRQICELAEQMGYRPDPALAQLARNRFLARTEVPAGALAYLVQTQDGCYRTHQLPSFAAVKRRAEERGYHVQQFDLASCHSGDAVTRMLHQRGILGVIIPRMPPGTAAYFTGAGWRQFAVACCSVGWVRPPFHVVAPDMFDAMRRLWRETVRRGYRRIGGAVFRHHPVSEDDHARYGAALVEQQELIPAGSRLPILRCEPEDRAAFLAWVERHRPDAIISFLSRGYEWLVEAGYRVPEDVAFACFGIWPHESFTGFAVPHDEVGRTTVDFLIEQLHANQRGFPEVPRTVRHERRWVEGRTLPTLEWRADVSGCFEPKVLARV
jgi:DNA-binding LacI/PurR family transcriptional regulator